VEVRPGPAVNDDDALLDFVRGSAQTSYHPVGSCRMGLDAGAVVDPELRVRGLSGLRVADASVIPTMCSANTNAPAMMIGIKAAQMILAEGGAP
jgi:choline dehydrogenase